MPTGDPPAPDSPPAAASSPAVNAAKSPPPAQPKLTKSKTMSPKSAEITARNNYVSPYRQQTPSRSVSQPMGAQRSNSAAGTNPGSKNFKEIVHRFNEKRDEKLPNPSNQVSGLATSTVRRRGQMATKAAAERAAAGKGSAGVGISTRTGVKSSTPGRPPRSKTLDETTAGRSQQRSSRNLLPPLQTSFPDAPRLQPRRRRSLSALDAPSPSAASLADNESDSRSATPILPKLSHRRSRSNIEFTSSPTAYLDPASAGAGRALGGGRTGKTPTQWTLHTPDQPTPRKPEVNIHAVTSPHGSRRGQPSTNSPKLTAYVSAPMPKKSPPLRSSRQRIPAADHGTQQGRQRTQVTGAGSITRERSKSRAAYFEEKARRESLRERKRPQLPPIDFAERRAKIQSALNQSLKEDDSASTLSRSASRAGAANKLENGPPRVGSATGSHSVKRNHTLRHSHIPKENMRGYEGVIQVIPAPNELNDAVLDAGHDWGNEERVAIQEKGEDIESGKGGAAKDVVPLRREASIIMKHKQRKADDSSDDDSEFLSSHGTPSPESPITQPKNTTMEDIPEVDLDEKEPTEEKAAKGIEGKEEGLSPNDATIPIVVTPDSPQEPSTVLSQVSNALRGSHVEWTDSELSAVDSPVVQRGFATGVSPTRITISGPDMETITEDNNARNDRDGAGLSPMVATASSDDRATINSIFNKYDEPREDFLDSYQNSPVVTRDQRQQEERDEEGVNENGGLRVEQEEWDSASPQSRVSSEFDEYDNAFHPDRYDRDRLTRGPLRLEIRDHRRSDSTGNGLSPYGTSPVEDAWAPEGENGGGSPDSADDYQTRQRTPKVIELHSPDKRDPPGKSPPVPEKDAKYKSASPSPSPSKIGTPSSGPAYLPEIETDSEPLGLAIQTLPSHYDFGAGSNRPISYHVEEYYSVPRESLDRQNLDRQNLDRQSIYEQSYEQQGYDHQGYEQQGAYSARSSFEQPRGSFDERRPNDYYYGRSANSNYAASTYHRPSGDQYAPYRPSMDADGRYSHASSVYSDMHTNRSAFMFSPPSGSQRMSETTIDAQSVHQRPSVSHPETPDEKRLRKRRNIMYELVDTEDTYARDMMLVVQIYQKTAESASLSQEDDKAIFGTTDTITDFAISFYKALRTAAVPVFRHKTCFDQIKMERNGVSRANSVSSIESRETVGMTEEERDRKTNIGQAFQDWMYRMEAVYGTYTKNHDVSVQRLQKLSTLPQVVEWLAQCRVATTDFTNAWNLESLLIKPVQRILKYPLLLKQLLECTPPDHPDYHPLCSAYQEMTFCANRLNDLKKRKDIVQNVVTGGKHEGDLRGYIAKSFARRAEKLRQSVGLSEALVDEKYNRLFENYNMHFVQVQVISRDVELYNAEIQGHVDKFIEFTRSFRDYAECVPTSYPEVEAKWKKFEGSMKEISETYLQEHKARVKKHAIDPLDNLLKLHASPQILMTKRNKKAVDYARWKAATDKGDTPDKKTTELAEQYTALNDTLIEELPRLFILTKKLVDAVLLNFIDIQADFLRNWAAKIRMTFTELGADPELEAVVNAFMGDFTVSERQLQALNMCNGSMIAMQHPAAALLYSNRSLPGSVEHIHRPRTADPDASRDRSNSLSDTPHQYHTLDPAEDRRHSNDTPAHRRPSASSFTPNFERRPSAVSAVSALSSVSSLDSSVPAVPQIPAPFRRTHTHAAAGSSASQIPPMQRRAYSNNISDSHAAAQASYFGALNRSRVQQSGSHLPPIISQSPNDIETPSPPLPSATFSSAMPMEDDRARTSRSPSRNASASRPGSRGSRRSGGMGSAHRGIEGAILGAGGVAGSVGVGGNGMGQGIQQGGDKPMFVVVSLYEFNIDRQRREAGFPYLTYVQGEVFDVIGVKGEIWLARNQDDANGEIGWIWCKHFVRLEDQ